MQSAFDIFFANGPGLPQNDLIAKFSIDVLTEVTVCSNDSFPQKNGNKHGIVEYFCVDCWKALCVECSRVHFKIKVTEQHKLRPIANIDEADINTRRRQLLSHCSLHTNEKLVLFCRQCQDIICSSCFAGDHIGHDCVELKEVEEKIVQELRKVQQEVLQRKVDVSKQMQSIESKINAVDNNKSEKLFELQVHIAKLRNKAHEAYMKIIAKINDVEEEVKKNVLEEVAKHKKCLLPLKDSCEKKMNKLHQINSAFDIILNPSTSVVEQCQFSTLWLDSEILPPICSEVLDPAVTSEIKLTNLVYVPVRVNCDESSSEELQVEATLSVPQSPLKSHENKIGVHVSQNYGPKHSVPMGTPVAVPGQYVYNASQPVPMYGATPSNFYPQQQMFVQQVQYQPGATPRMPTPAQYQMTPNMQQAQQKQPQQQVYAYLQPPQQQQTTPIGLYGTSPAQYQQAMTVGQQQQQQVTQYLSQQVPVVATAPAPVPQFHPLTQPASQPTQPKRERKPLAIIDPVAERKVAVTQHRTPERTTPQPSIVKKSVPATPALPETSTTSQSLPEVDQLKLSDARKEDDGGVMTEGKDADSDMPQDDVDEDGVTKDLGDRGDSALKDIFRSKSVELKYQYKPDQWSPLYTEGKKQYDRDFLLQFQAKCVDKPIGLPNIPDITLSSPLGKLPWSPGIDFTPSFAKTQYQGLKVCGDNYIASLPDNTKNNSAKGGPGGHRGPHSSGQNSRSKQKGPPPAEPPRQHKVITLEKVDVQLHHTENAWKPNPLKAAPEVSANAAEETASLLSSIPAPPKVSEIQAQFAARVAARMREPSQSEGRNAQGPLPTTGSNVSGSESKPQDTASSVNSKQEAVFVTAGHVVAMEPTPTVVTSTTVTRNLEPRTVVRCAYAEGQWSPSNQSGEKRYNVEFLLQFKDVYYQRPSKLKHMPGCTAPPDDSPFYRTRMCHHLKACTKGDEYCLYAHKPEDIRSQPKWRMCRNVERTGYCIHGDECVFAHTVEEMNEAIEARRRSENENMT